MSVQIAQSLSSTITLNDGVKMPMFGLGLFRAEGEEVEVVVAHALKHGYRLIDTAAFHGTEEAVGWGIRSSGVSREDIFIISKPWIDSHGRDNVKEAFHNSLAKLNIGYVDLYMIHSPVGGRNVETYQAIQELKEEGLIRYEKNVGQILARWSVQNGFITIPKSTRPERIEQNSHVFDWCLEDEDMITMSKFPQASCRRRRDWTPMESEWTG